MSTEGNIYTKRNEKIEGIEGVRKIVEGLSQESNPYAMHDDLGKQVSSNKSSTDMLYPNTSREETWLASNDDRCYV